MDTASRVFPVDTTVDLFAGFPVRDYEISLSWYNQLLSKSPSFFPNDIEAVWELSEHRYLYIKVLPEQAGEALNLVFLSDLNVFLDQVSRRGLKPALIEGLPNGVRKAIYMDPDGNHVEFGGSFKKP